MSKSDDDDPGLKQIIQKLEHPIEEIRVRALTSIIFKLEHGILRTEQLLDESRLLVALLEWFNFETVSNQDAVLALLLKFIREQPTCRKRLTDMGGVEFMSKLRGDSQALLHPIIDQILEQLFLLPNFQPDDSPPASDPVVTIAGEAPRHSPETNKSQNKTGPNCAGYSAGLNPTGNGNSPAPDQTKPTSAHPISSAEHSGFRLISLDRLPISARDFHILESTNESIASRDPHLVSNACNVLNDVILRDFPPEIFLQHSRILLSLIELLANRDGHPLTTIHTQLALRSVQCLSTFLRSLTAKIGSCCDAATYNHKRATHTHSSSQSTSSSSTTMTGSSNSSGSYASRPSVIGQSDSRLRGDGQDGEAAATLTPNVNVDDATGGVRRHNGSHEIGIPQLCVAVYANCQALLQTSNPKLLVSTAQLLDLCCHLLATCVNPALIYDDPGQLARDFVPHLMACYHALSDSLEFHRTHFEQAVSSTAPHQPITTQAIVHRLAYVTLAASLIRLLRAGVDLRSVTCDSPLLRAACGPALTALSLDFALRETHPELHGTIVAHARLLSVDAHLYTEASVIASAISASIKFSRDCGSSMGTKSGNNHEASSTLGRLHLARRAIYCLHFRSEGADLFLDTLLKLVSARSWSEISDEERGQSRRLLLSLLACGEQCVRQKIYSKLFDLVAATLTIDGAVAHPPGLTSGIDFLLSAEILHQIVVYGLQDSVVVEAARAILRMLLMSELIVGGDSWRQFLDALYPVLSRLQAYTDSSTPLGQALFQLVETDNSHWTKLDLLRSNIRLLFLKDERLKTRVVPRLAWFLGSQDQALYLLPPLSRIDVSGLASAFAAPSSAHTSGVAPTDFSRPHFEELLELFLDGERSARTRLSAAYQFIFLLNDASLFDVFRRNNGTARVVTALVGALTTDAPGSRVQRHRDTVDLVPVCAEVLRHSVTRDNEVATWLVNDQSIYYSLLRAALLFPTNDAVRSDITLILARILFPDDLSRHSNFLLPFNPSTLSGKSKYHTDLPSVRTADPFLEARVASFLRLSEWKALGAMETGAKDKLGADWSAQETSDRMLPVTETGMIRMAGEMADLRSHFVEVGQAVAHRPALVALKVLYLRCGVAISGLGAGGCEIDVNMLDAAFARFLSTKPKSNADKNLLKNVVSILDFLLSKPLHHELLDWMYEQLCGTNGALHSLLLLPADSSGTHSDNASPASPLVREVIAFVTSLFAATPYDPGVVDPDRVQRSFALMTAFIMRHMNSVEAPQFYNLTSLETFLRCLVHVTARPHFGLSPSGDGASVSATCRKLTTLLMEVVVSFHLERDARDHSFMGRGVTVAATLCLAHLAARMQDVATREGDQDWIRAWFYNHRSSEVHNQLGLGWLIPLWTHTDLEVRAASLSVVVSLTRTKACYRVVSEQMREVAGGLWGVALSFLLDHSEASMVREHAALLLVNLTTHMLTCIGKDEESWQGAIIVGTTNQAPLVGQAALLALLHRSNFVHEMVATFHHLSLQRTFQPRVVPVQRTGSDSQVPWSWTTMTSFQFNAHGISSSTTPTTTSSSSNVTASSPDTGSTSRSTEDRADEVVSVATPALVASICLLLRNLVSVASQEVLRLARREDLLGHLLEILESGALFVRKKENRSVNANAVYFHEVIDMLRNVIDLLSSLCRADSRMSQELFNASDRPCQLLIGLLIMASHECSVGLFKEDVDNLQTSVYMLLTVNISSVTEEVNLVNYLQVLTDRFGELFTNLIAAFEPVSSSAKRSVVLVWLSHVIAKLLFVSYSTSDVGRDSASRFSEILDNEEVKFGDGTTKPGSILANKLIALYGSVPHNIQTAEDLESLECVNDALTNLIAISDAARDTAVSAGLIASVVNRMNRIHAHSNLPSSVENGRLGSGTSNNKMAFVDVDLICQMNLLKNMMHRNEKAKILANDVGLVTTVSYFWSCVVLDREKLLPSVLSMLCNYVARCAPAAKSLTVPTVVVPLTSTSRSLLYEVQWLCQQEILRGPKNANLSILELGFAILASSSFVPACRGLLAKSKLLVIYANEEVKKLYRGTRRESYLSMWLKLLVNLSFKTEGQEIIVSLPDIVEVLLDVLNTGPPSDQESALLVLRNLCFLPKRKSKFLHSGNLLAALVTIALEGRNHFQTLAASALWALLSNSRKGKTTLKTDHIIHSIQDALEALKNKLNELNDAQTKSLEILETVLALLNES